MRAKITNLNTNCCLRNFNKLHHFRKKNAYPVVHIPSDPDYPPHPSSYPSSFYRPRSLPLSSSSAPAVLALHAPRIAKRKQNKNCLFTQNIKII